MDDNKAKKWTSVPDIKMNLIQLTEFIIGFINSMKPLTLTLGSTSRAYGSFWYIWISLIIDAIRRHFTNDTITFRPVAPTTDALPSALILNTMNFRCYQQNCYIILSTTKSTFKFEGICSESKSQLDKAATE